LRKELKMKKIFEAIRENTMKRLSNLELMLEAADKKHPVITKLLNVPSNVLYELVECSSTDMNSLEWLVGSMVHAFDDDGDWSLTRVVDQDMMDFLEELEVENQEVHYKYALKHGDYCYNAGIEAVLIYEKDWDTIIDTYMLHVQFGIDNESKLDGSNDAVEMEYSILQHAVTELYARMFEERLVV